MANLTLKANQKARNIEDRASEIEQEKSERELSKSLEILKLLSSVVVSSNGEIIDGVSPSLVTAYKAAMIRASANASAYNDAWGDPSGS